MDSWKYDKGWIPPKAEIKPVEKPKPAPKKGKRKPKCEI